MFNNVNLLTIFTTGLLTGGLTCMAVQGGLLAATLAQREEEKLKSHAERGNALPILSFLIAKLIAYTVLGVLLGWLGSLVQPSLQAKVVLQIAVVIFMLGTALNILRVHPVFRYFVIQPPRFLTRLVRKQSKRGIGSSRSSRIGDILAPAILGAFTIFIPCGTTQAMMALAIGVGNPLMGGAILFAFVLGTSPIFFVLGYMTMKLGDVLQQRFMKIAAFVIILIALFNLDAAISLTGSQYTGAKLLQDGFCLISFCAQDQNGSQAAAVNEQTITITPSGYEPAHFVVKSGSTVTLHLVNKGAGGCIQAFTIPSLNIQKVVPSDKSDNLTFTAPSKPGQISFMCSMGMYPGTIDVI